MQALRGLWLLEHVERQALGRSVLQPFLDCQTVAFCFRDLLSLVVEEQLVIETFGRCAAKRAADFRRQRDAIDQVFAGHFIINAESCPAHRPVSLPLAFDVTAGHRRFDFLIRFGINVSDRALCRVARNHWHLQDASGSFADRQERRIGGLPLRPKRRQDDLHHLIIDFEHLQQGRIHRATLVTLGGGEKFILEAKLIEKLA